MYSREKKEEKYKSNEFRGYNILYITRIFTTKNHQISTYQSLNTIYLV